MRTKQVIVVRKDLNMRKGKIAAQAAHASLKVFLDRAEKKGDDSILITGLGAEEMDWVFGVFTKPVCSVDSEEALLGIYNKAIELGLPCSLITDSGKTEFHGVPTNTAVAVGPAEVSRIDEVTAGLPLL